MKRKTRRRKAQREKANHRDVGRRRTREQEKSQSANRRSGTAGQRTKAAPQFSLDAYIETLEWEPVGEEVQRSMILEMVDFHIA